MQDWNYIYGGCFELTLEISDTKWPKASEVICFLSFFLLICFLHKYKIKFCETFAVIFSVIILAKCIKYKMI